MCQHTPGVVSARHLYGAAAELGKATQLCVFILGTQYLSLGVLRCVFGVRYVVSVLLKSFWAPGVETRNAW